MAPLPARTRRLLFLQGPHGPFFDRLAALLREAGARTWRVGFTQGDAAFWHHPAGYIADPGPCEDWPDRCARLLDDHAITDLVLYGDSRPIHAAAIRLARDRGIVVHVFEEGYLRPHWVTYERGGSNGNSRLMAMSIAEMRGALAATDPGLPGAPAHWGDLAHHVAWGALYHFHVLLRNGAYPGYRPHRGIGVAEEFRLSLRRLAALPWYRAERALATRALRASGRPYHLVLTQLDHDASLRAHSGFAGSRDFADLCLAGFAAGAPGHHQLVFKAHPLDDGRDGLRGHVARRAAELGLAGRVRFVPGGKLAEVLDEARSVVTVNSTAAHQALWRGIAVRAFGRAVYGKPELVSDQPLAAFFAAPRPPDTRAYRDFRRFLLETSQLPGGFYAARSRRRLLRAVVDRMLDARDPYEALSGRNPAPHAAGIAAGLQQVGPAAGPGLSGPPAVCHAGRTSQAPASRRPAKTEQRVP